MAVDPKSLRQLLKQKRALIRPETVGLLPRPSGGRGRPSPGLTQDQMDELLHRTPGTYARLEGGRLKTVTPVLGEEIARLLGFSGQDWEAFWAYQLGQGPPFPLHPRDFGTIDRGWAEVLPHIGMPAYISDQGWNVVAQNQMFVDIFPDGIPPANTMRWMALSAQGRRMLHDWPTVWMPSVLPQLRAAIAAFPENETLQELDYDARRDAVVGRIYSELQGAFTNPDGDRRRMYHAGLMTSGWMRISHAQPGGSPGARLIVLNFTPDGGWR